MRFSHFLKAAAALFSLAAIALIAWQYYCYLDNSRLLEEGTGLINEGKIKEGLAVCDQMRYGKGRCYTAALGTIIERGQAVSEDFCSSMPYDDFGKTWSRDEKQRYKSYMADAAALCYGHVPYRLT